jgi:ADP-ribosylglycohydrolase
MLSREELRKKETLCRDRATGCLAGLAVGDAIGDIGRIDAYRQRYGIVTNLYEGAKSTDDTEFALLTARTLLDNGGVLSLDAVEGAWRKYILDNGGMLARGGRPLFGAVENLRRGLKPPQSGIDNVFNNDDGAAMRIAPVGIVYAGEPRKAAEAAEVEAQISHYEDGVWAAKAVAASVSIAMVGGSIGDILAAGLEQIPNDSWLWRSMTKAMKICEDSGSIEKAWEPIHTELWTPEHAASEEAIPQIYALLRLTEGDFGKGLFWAANFGRDADTISAVVGAVAGALHGIGVIPKDWVEMVRRPAGTCLKFAAQEDIVQIGQELAALLVQMEDGKKTAP